MKYRLESVNRETVYFDHAASAKDFLRGNGCIAPKLVAALTLLDWEGIVSQSKQANFNGKWVHPSGEIDWQKVALDIGADTVEREGIDYNVPA